MVFPLNPISHQNDRLTDDVTRLAWMIDPFSQQTTIFRPDQVQQTKSFADVLSGDDVLPGFTLQISEL